MKKILFAITLVIGIQSVKGQQDAMFTHYMYNTLWLNPAYAGTRDALTITGLHRSQWVGFDGAPVDQTLTLHTPMLNGKMGIGLSVLNDKIGPTKSTLIALDLAYHLKLTSKSKLSFGLKGLVNLYSNSLSSVQLTNQTDRAFGQNISNVLPNAGAGLYYHRERFYVGVSSPRLLQNKLTSTASAGSIEQRHYFFIMGTVFDLSKSVKLKPTCFVKATEGAPLEGDVTANFIFNDRFTLGAMYRTGDAVGALVGYNFSEQFCIGYSFDWSMANTTGKYNHGSHEIMLRYDLISKSKAKIKSPRYF